VLRAYVVSYEGTVNTLHNDPLFGIMPDVAELLYSALVLCLKEIEKENLDISFRPLYLSERTSPQEKTGKLPHVGESENDLYANIGN